MVAHDEAVVVDHALVVEEALETDAVLLEVVPILVGRRRGLISCRRRAGRAEACGEAQAELKVMRSVVELQLQILNLGFSISELDQAGVQLGYDILLGAAESKNRMSDRQCSSSTFITSFSIS